MNLTDVKSKEIMPGFHGKIIHGENVTWVYWNIDKGSSLNEHHHVHEQIMHVLEGEFEFILNGKKNICMPGSYFVIPLYFMALVSLEPLRVYWKNIVQVYCCRFLNQYLQILSMHIVLQRI